jgi:integrase
MGRRGNGEGSISRHKKSGLYMARYTVETPAGEKRKTIYARTRREAAERLAEALANRGKGLVLDDENMTVGEYLDKWLSDCVRGSVRESTFSCDKYLVTNHVVPTLGRRKLKNLNALHLQGLYRERLDSGLSGSTVQKIHHVVHKALAQAAKWNLFPRNHADAVKAPTPTPKEMNPLSASEARRLLEAARGDRREALYVLAVHTSMRRGELLGLKWGDVDLDNATVRVQRTLTRTDNGRRLALGEPKTKKSRRTVRLTQGAVEALRSHGAKQAEETAKGGSPLPGPGPRLRRPGRRLHQPLQLPPAVLRAAPQAREAGPDHLQRPAPHLRVAALPEERSPQVRARAIGPRLRGDHARHLLPHAAGDGRRGLGLEDHTP